LKHDTYDNLGRLNTETVTGSIQDGKNGTVTYGYDNIGNRLARSSSLSGVTNQALGYYPNDRVTGDTYDNNGNTKSAPISQPSTLNKSSAPTITTARTVSSTVLGLSTLNPQLSTSPTTAMATASAKSLTARSRPTWSTIATRPDTRRSSKRSSTARSTTRTPTATT
jgi:hypothetical protein